MVSAAAPTDQWLVCIALRHFYTHFKDLECVCIYACTFKRQGNGEFSNREFRELS